MEKQVARRDDVQKMICLWGGSRNQFGQRQNISVEFDKDGLRMKELVWGENQAKQERKRREEGKDGEQ